MNCLQLGHDTSVCFSGGSSECQPLLGGRMRKDCAAMGLVVQQGVLWSLGKCGLGKTVPVLFCTAGPWEQHPPAAWLFWEIAAFPDGKAGAQCLFFSLCLFLSCFSPQLHITESLEIQLFHQLFAVEKAARNVQ